MNISSFSPEQFKAQFKENYGEEGTWTVRLMVGSLNAHKLSLTYDKDSEKFTIQGSAKIDAEKIKEIFSNNYYEAWVPEVLDTTDAMGNRLVKLKSIPYKSPGHDSDSE